MKNNVKLIPIGLIKKPTIAMRSVVAIESLTDLIESIGNIGLINPITVVERGGLYEIIAGDRRYSACSQLRWDEIPCNVLMMTELETLRMRSDENAIREGVTAIDEGIYFREIMSTYHINQTELGILLNKKSSYISERLQALEYPDEMKEALRSELMTFSVARELNRIKDDNIKIHYTRFAINNGVTPDLARQLKNYGKRLLMIGKKSRKKPHWRRYNMRYINNNINVEYVFYYKLS